MRNIFIDELIKHAEKDERIFLITADLGYGVVTKFSEKFPERFLNSGITEQSTVSLAAGLASQGFRPFVYSIANFPTFRAMEQLRNDVNYMQLGVTIVALGEGLSYGSAGYSHHLIEDISSVRVFDHFSIYSPTADIEVRSSVKQILGDNRSALLRLGRLPEVSSSFKLDVTHFEGFNKWHAGQMVNLVFHGGLADELSATVQELSENGVSASAFSCYNIDASLVASFLKSESSVPTVVVEEHTRSGGLGSVFLEVANDLDLQIRLLRIGIDKVNREFVGGHQYLRRSYGLDSISISKNVLEFYRAGNKS